MTASIRILQPVLVSVPTTSFAHVNNQRVFNPFGFGDFFRLSMHKFTEFITVGLICHYTLIRLLTRICKRTSSIMLQCTDMGLVLVL